MSETEQHMAQATSDENSLLWTIGWSKANGGIILLAFIIGTSMGMAVDTPTLGAIIGFVGGAIVLNRAAEHINKTHAQYLESFIEQSRAEFAQSLPENQTVYAMCYGGRAPPRLVRQFIDPAKEYNLVLVTLTDEKLTLIRGRSYSLKEKVRQSDGRQLEFELDSITRIESYSEDGQTVLKLSLENGDVERLRGEPTISEVSELESDLKSRLKK